MPKKIGNFPPNMFNSTIILTEKSKNDDNKEYNPFDHRDMQHSYSTAGSMAHLLKYSLGTGILAMPMAFKNSGLLLGAVGTLAIGILCAHCIHILVRTSQNICEKTKIPSLGFAETVKKAFECGPAATRKYAKFAGLFVNYGLTIGHLATCSIYIVFMGTTFHDMANYVLNINFDVRLYIAVVLLPCICIGEIRQLKYLVPFSMLGNVFSLVTFSITFYYMLTGPLDISERPVVASWKQVPFFISTVFFAIDSVGTVLPVENSMRNPKHFLGCPGVLTTTITILVILYAAMGFFGYVRYGDDIKGSVTMNLPDGLVAAQVAQILIAFTLLFSFGIAFFIPADILWRKCEPKISKEKRNIVQILFRAGLIVFLGAVAAAVPKLGPFIGLAGAIFISMLGLFVPAVVETVFLFPNDFGVCNWILYKNIIIMITAILALGSGSFVSILEIIHMYSS